MKIVEFFLPKDRVFHQLFDKIGANIVDASQLLETFVQASDEEKKSAFLQLKQKEHENDILSNQIIIELGQNFITPFDREDIHALAESLDEVINYIYATAKKIKFYQIDSNEECIRQSISPIVKSCLAIQSGLMGLKTLKDTERINSSIQIIRKSEKEADDLFDWSIKRLFDETDDMKELIMRREVYQYLESITDRCKVVGKIIGTIAIKYA